MLGLSSIGARLVTIAGSAAIHVSVFAAFAGHGPAQASSAPAAVEVEIQVDTPPPVPEAPAPQPVAEPETHDHAQAVPHSHVHPYPVPASHDATPHDPSLVHLPSLAARDHDDEPASPAAPPEVVAAAAPVTVRFTMPLGTVSTFAGGATQAGGSGNGNLASSGDSAAVPESAASVPAKLIRGGTPPYPAQARAEEIEADVPMEIVVDQSGAVTDARVVRHVGYGFDEAALKAIRSFRFSSAERDGHPVRVRMKWSVVFRLK